MSAQPELPRELQRTTGVDRAELARIVTAEPYGRDVVVPVALGQRVLNDLHADRAELERLRAIERRAIAVRDSWRNGHRPEIGEDQEAVALYILGEAT